MGMKGKTIKSVFSACTSIVALSICLTAGAVQGTGTVDAVGGLNLRSGQATTSGKITVLPNQAKIQINYEDNGWYNVTYAGLTGFVKQEYVKLDQQETSSVTEVVEQTPVVESGEVQYRIVNAEGGLRLRETPDANGQTLDIMPYNSRIQFFVRDGEWAQVEYNGMQGYCSAVYLRVDDTVSQETVPQTPIASETIQTSEEGVAGYITISGGLRLRSSGSNDAEIIATMPQYAAITILDDSTGWAKVSYQGQVGYCSRQYIAYGIAQNTVGDNNSSNNNNNSQTPVAPSVPSTEQATVNANGGLSLRSEASTEGERLTIIPNGSSVVITSTRDDGWSEVVYGNLTGYVSNDYLVNYQSGTNNEGTTSQAKTKGDEVVEAAKKFLGVPYVYGGTSPDGFDCSGFTYYVYKQFGVTLNRTSSAQYLNGTSVSKSDLKPGDLVFFSQNGSSSIGHVGIYVGNDQFIHSPQTGDVVKISSMTSASYSLRYVGARRIFN